MKKFKLNEKTWNMAGIILGIIIIITGIVIMATPATRYWPHATEDVTFGADFYTYQYEVTAIAARNVSAAANNIGELSEKLTLYNGLAFMVAGALVVINYGKKLTATICSDSEIEKVEESSGNEEVVEEKLEVSEQVEESVEE